MFTTLHELAKRATLMITVAAEGDGQLRVNVTPMPFDPKAKSNLPQPLSLLATPVEFDADFVAALSTWQAPKRSLIQQAQDATGGAATTSTPALPAPKAEAKGDSKVEKTTRKPRAGKSSEDEKKVEDAVPAAAAAAGEAAAAADQVMAASTSTDAGEQLPASAGESGASTNTEAATEQGSQPAADAGAVGAQDVVEGAGDAAADAGHEGAPEPVVTEDPVDKFTLDLF
jgi:PRTRC genetic system protein E